PTSAPKDDRAVIRLVDKLREAGAGIRLAQGGFVRPQMHGKAATWQPGDIGSAAMQHQLIMKADATGWQHRRPLLPRFTCGGLHCLGIKVAKEVAIDQPPAL